MSEGLSSISLCQSASTLPNSASASAGLPVFDSRLASALLHPRQFDAKSGDGGVVGDQLLPNRHRLAELGLRLRRLARLQQQVAEVPAAPPQLVAELGDGGVVVGQLLHDFHPLAVLRLRLRWLAAVQQQLAEPVVAVRPGSRGIG